MFERNGLQIAEQHCNVFHFKLQCKLKVLKSASSMTSPLFIIAPIARLFISCCDPLFMYSRFPWFYAIANKNMYKHLIIAFIYRMSSIHAECKYPVNKRHLQSQSHAHCHLITSIQSNFKMFNTNKT